MSFVVQAGMARELVPVNTQHQRWGLVRRVRRALGMLLVPVAYLGALIALPYVIGGTFLLLTTFAERFGLEAYWTVVGGFTLGTWKLCFVPRMSIWG